MNSVYFIWMIFFALFRSGHFHNIVSTFTNVLKFDVENDNVVSTLSNVVHVNFEINNVDSTLWDVVNLNVEIRNVVSTLIWHCPSRNVGSTKRQRWNNVEMFAGFTTWTWIYQVFIIHQRIKKMANYFLLQQVKALQHISYTSTLNKCQMKRNYIKYTMSLIFFGLVARQ